MRCFTEKEATLSILIQLSNWLQCLLLLCGKLLAPGAARNYSDVITKSISQIMQYDNYLESPLEIEEIQKKRKRGAGVALTAKGMLKKYLIKTWILINTSPITSLIKISIVNKNAAIKIYLPTTTFSMDAKATSWSPKSTGSALSCVLFKENTLTKHFCSCYYKVWMILNVPNLLSFI